MPWLSVPVDKDLLISLQPKVEKDREGIHQPKAQTAGPYPTFLSMKHG